MADQDPPKTFWTSVPGILTGIAAVVAAVGGLITVFQKNAPSSPPSQNQPESLSPPIVTILKPDPYFLASPELLLVQRDIHGGLQLGKVYWQQEVWIGGERFEHAIGMHAPDNGTGYADFSIPRGARYFVTTFGIARDDKAPEKYGDAIGRISIDGTLVWERNTMGLRAVESPTIKIPINAKTLRLEVDSKGTNALDQTAWGNPRFTGSQ